MPTDAATDDPRDARRMAETLKDLRRFYAAGQKSLREYPHRMGYGAAAATVDGFGGEMLRKARAFADERTGYTEQELQQLLDTCLKHGFPLGISHVIKLVSVTTADGTADRRRRSRLQLSAIRERWPRRRLEQEIQGSMGLRQTKAGRSVTTPRDEADALYKLSQFCGQWRRLSRAVESFQADDANGPRGLPPDVERLVRQVDTAILRLDAAVSPRVHKPKVRS